MDRAVGAWWCADCQYRVGFDLQSLAVGEDTASAIAWGEAALRSLASAVPGVGLVTGLVIDGSIAARNAAALDRWLAIVDARFEQAGRMFNPDDPIAIAHFNRLTQGALQSHRTERLRMLADAAVSVGETSAVEDALQRRLVDLTLRLEPEHIGYMLILNDPRPYVDAARVHDAGLQSLLLPGEPLRLSFNRLVDLAILGEVEEKDLVREAVGRDLMNEGLTSAGYGKDTSLDDIVEYPLTPLGLRFLNFLGR